VAGQWEDSLERSQSEMAADALSAFIGPGRAEVYLLRPVPRAVHADVAGYLGRGHVPDCVGDRASSR